MIKQGFWKLRRLKNVQQWYPVFASIPVWHPAVTSWSGRILLFSRDCGMHCRHPYLSWKSRKWPACCIRQAPGIFEWVPHSWWLLLYHLCRCQNIRQKIYKSIAWYIIYLGIVRAVQLTTDIVFFERRRHQKNAKPQVLILGLAPCFILQLRKSGIITLLLLFVNTFLHFISIFSIYLCLICANFIIFLFIW